MSATAPDFYAPIHKAIRYALADMVKQLGATDPADSGAWDRAARSWTELEALLAAHSHHEDNHFHPLISAVAPDVTGLLDEQHARLETLVGEITRGFAVLAELANAGMRRLCGRDVYRNLTGFIADYFTHLLDEETKAMPALLDAYPVDVLVATHRALLADIGPEQLLADLPLVIRALAPHERAELMEKARAGAPAPVFDRFRETALAALSPDEFVKLQRDLGFEVAAT